MNHGPRGSADDEICGVTNDGWSYGLEQLGLAAVGDVTDVVLDH